jgi:hypothetical protein
MKNRFLFIFISFIVISSSICSCVSGKKSEDTGSSNIKVINGKDFTVQYPTTWYVDTLDEEYDADKLFSINTDSGQNYTAFFLFDHPIDIEDHINTQIETNKEVVMTDGLRTDFSTWGKYKGKGAILNGSFFSAHPGKIKVFAYTTPKKGFLIFQQTYDEDEAKNKQGFELIERSFELK